MNYVVDRDSRVHRAIVALEVRGQLVSSELAEVMGIQPRYVTCRLEAAVRARAVTVRERRRRDTLYARGTELVVIRGEEPAQVERQARGFRDVWDYARSAA